MSLPRRTRRAAKPSGVPRKPMAMARRVSWFEREISMRLAPVAIDLLHGSARVLSEGELAGDLYTGSTMLTIDLARTADRVSDPPDASTAQRIAFLYAADERAREHARRIALAEARRAARCELATAHVDVESRAQGAELHLSLNVEARAAPRSTQLPSSVDCQLPYRSTGLPRAVDRKASP